MKQTLIKITNDHYVVVDDSEIKEDCYALHEGPLGEREIVTANDQCKLDKKITHSTQPLELSSENGLSGMGFSKVRPLNVFEVKELIGEVDVEKNMWYERNVQNPYSSDSLLHTGFNKGFELGYNQAIEDNKDKKYADEDVINAYKLGIEDSENVRLFGREEVIKDFTKELSKSVTEWEVTFDEQGKLKLV